MAQTVNSHSFSRVAAITLVASVLLILVIGIIFSIQQGCHIFFDLDALYPVERLGRFLSFIGYFGFVCLGALIILYQPGNHTGWLLSGYGGAQLITILCIQLESCSQTMPLASSIMIIIPWVILIGSFLTLAFLGFFLMIFPNGQYLSTRWRWLSLLLFAFMIAYNLFALSQRQFTPPSGGDALTSFVVPTFIFPLLGILALFLRWRRVIGDVRQQIKWVAFFLVTIGTSFIIVESIGSFGYPEIYQGWFYAFLANSFVIGFPVVIGLAIFRYRLYDIDILIRRTVQYAAVSAILIATYYGSVVLLQTIFTSTVGEQSPLVIVVSTLVTAALFNPLRTRLQTFIDRRFYRQKYNAEQILSHFAQTARDEVELDVLQDELLRVVQDTMQPENISLWLKAEGENA